jgi:hypothetical protein
MGNRALPMTIEIAYERKSGDFADSTLALLNSPGSGFLANLSVNVIDAAESDVGLPFHK